MMQEQQVVMSAPKSDDAWSGFSFSMSIDVNGALEAVDGSPLELPGVDSGSDERVLGKMGSDDMAKLDREDSWPQTEVMHVLGDTLGDPERLDATMALLHIVADSAGSYDKTSPEDSDPSDADLVSDGALLMRVRSVLRAMDRDKGRQEELVGILERLAGVGRLRGTLVMLKGVITDTKVVRQRSSYAELDDGHEPVGPPVAKLQRKATISALRALLPDVVEWGTVDDHLSRIFTSILEPAPEGAPSVEHDSAQGTTTEPVLDPATHFSYTSEAPSSVPSYGHLISAPVAPVTHLPYVEQQQPIPPPLSVMATSSAPTPYDPYLHVAPQPVDMSVPCQSREAGGMAMPTRHQQQQLRPQPFVHLTSPTAHPITLDHAHEIPPSTPCHPGPMPPYVPLVSPSAGGHPAPMYGPPQMMMVPSQLPHAMSPVEHPYPPQYVAYPPVSPYMMPVSPGMAVSPGFHMGAMGAVPSPQHMMENIPINGQHQGYWHPGMQHPFDDNPKKGGNKRGDYRCGKCGELKRNHTCKKVVKEMKEMATQVDDCLTLATGAETPVLPKSWPAAFRAVRSPDPAPTTQSTTAPHPGRARASSTEVLASV